MNFNIFKSYNNFDVYEVKRDEATSFIIISKNKEYKTLTDLSNEALTELTSIEHDLIALVSTEISPYFNIYQSEVGSEYLSVQLVPRFEGDGFSQDEVYSLMEKINETFFQTH